VTRRRLLWALLAAVLAAAALRAPALARDALARRLQALFGRPATVGALSVRVFPLRIEVREVTVGGARPSDPPFLHLRRAEMRPSLRPRWGGLHLRQLTLQGLRVHVQAYEGGGDDLPPFRLPAGGSEARIGRLVVEEAELVVDHQRVPLALDLPDVQGTLQTAAGGGLAGRLAFGAGSVRVGDRDALQVASDVDLVLRQGRIDVTRGRLVTEKTDLSYRGTVQLAGGVRGRFTVSGPVDLAVMDRHVMESGFGLRGHARYVGELHIEGSRLELQGRLQGTQGEFDGVAVARYAGELTWKQGRLQVRDLAVSAMQGQGRFDIDLPPPPGTVRLRAELEGMDAEALSRLVFDVGAAGLGAAASGRMDLHWPRGRNRDLSGTVQMDLAPRADGRTPLGGRVEWRAENGRQQVERAHLQTPSAQVRFSGRIERDRRTDLEVDADSADLAAADALLVRVRRALAAPAPRPAEIGGSGSFHGRWRGTLDEPVFEGRFSGQEVSYLGVVWGRAEWAGTLSSNALESRSLVVRREGAELWLDGSQRTGLLGDDDAMELTVRLKGWPASDLLRALEWELPLEAPLSGEVELRGRRSRPEGHLALTAPAGRYAGVAHQDLRLQASLHGDHVRLREGRAAVGGGALRFHGTLTEDGVYDGAASLEAVEVGELAAAWPPAVRPGGRLSGTLVMSGPLERPRVRAELHSPRLFLGEEGIGALTARVTGSGDGQLDVSAECKSGRVDLALRGAVAAAAPYAARLEVTGRDTSIDPFLRAARPELPEGVPLVASAQMQVSGPLLRPRELELRARVSDLQLLFPDYPVRALGAVDLALVGGRLELGTVHLGGEGTDLVASGRADLVGDGPLEIEARGAADLRILTFFSPELRGRGAARVALAVSGLRSAPRLEGTLDVQGAALRVRRFPHGIEHLQGTVRFTHQGAHLEEGTGLVGGAPVRVRGQAAWPAGKGLSFDVQAAGEGIALRYPEGLRSVVDADLRFFGDQRLQWLTGTVKVKQAVWTRRYDVASELLAERPHLERSPQLEGGLRYDLKVTAPGTLKIDNNLASLQAGADLQLQGTAGLPVVLGRAEVDRGRVYFQGNTYLIRRGSIDFANPRRTDPLFDIEAETRIHSYRVTLRVNGTLERVYPTLTSDPYLSQVAILSLLAGGDEATVASLDTRRDDAQARLAVTGAATLAAGRISEEVGLERGAERLLGLSRFSIDPSAVRGDVTNPTARLTVGKRLTPDMALVYSVDLRGTEERLVSVEYTLSERVSVLLTRAEPGGFGFDLRLRQSR
jgi:translocation and assembly module TamB